MFENDWKKIMLHDVARNKEKREKVKEILWRYNEELRLIFRFYSSQSGRDIAYMNLIGWLGFCKICFINDDFFTISQLDEIFRRVNIEEEYDDEKLDSDPYNYRNAMMLKADPFNPDNQFTRSEFFEAIARAAIRKYTNLRLSPEEAVEKLMQQHVLRYALKPSHSDLRQKLLDNTVQRVYALYSSRLFYLFNRYTNLDRSDMKRTAKQTMNITEYRQFLRDYSLLDSDTSHRQAMSAFAMSQVEELDQADQSGLYEMVYAEFLEVIGRLANYRYAGVKSGYGDEEMDLAEKVQTILMRVFPSNRKKGKR